MTTLPVASAASRKAARVLSAVNRPWVRVAGVVVALALSLWSFDRVPDASWPPALIALVPWVVGKYLLCPLRWHALSMSGRSRRWHLRIYAESELLGLASPGHVGADLWRMHRLQTGACMTRPSALAEVGLDRLVGAVGLTVFVLVSGATLPPQVMGAALGVAALVFLGALVLRRRRPDLLAGRPLPPPRVVIKGALLSMGYQLTIMGLLMGTVAAMGEQLQPLALLGVFGASQVAGIVPGVNGASPREGALVVGLASLGVSWSAAVGAVALMAVLAWAPAVLLGGGSFAVHRIAASRASRGTPAAA
ncbi:MAG: lysylphosphatidylglycerol synthase transmembrane domain-containing protein [Actinomycetes bacterium]